MPVLGWSIRAAGFVPVDRGNRARGISTVEAALKLLKAGRSLVIFPEETRTHTGDLLPFKSGRGAAGAAVGVSAPRRRASRGPASFCREELSRCRPAGSCLSIGPPIEVAGRSARERNDVTRELRQAIAELREEAARFCSSRFSGLKTDSFVL